MKNILILGQGLYLIELSSNEVNSKQNTIKGNVLIVY